MRVPGGAGAGLERDAVADGACGFGRLKERVDADCAGKVFGLALAGGLAAGAFDFHDGLLALNC
jgi:hypothetical protein